MQQLWKSSANNLPMVSRCINYGKAVQTTVIWWVGATADICILCVCTWYIEPYVYTGWVGKQLPYYDMKSSANNLPMVSRCNNRPMVSRCNNRPMVSRQTTVLWWVGATTVEGIHRACITFRQTWIVVILQKLLKTLNNFPSLISLEVCSKSWGNHNMWNF